MKQERKILRERCRERLQELELPHPFDVRTFCHQLAVRRGRPIILSPLTSGGAESGLWVSGPTTDYIFYEPDTTPLHQAQIQLHEACHLVCGHRPLQLTDAELSDLVWPDLQGPTVRHVLQRAGYSSMEEYEAELLASMILDRVASGPNLSAGGRAIGPNRVIERLEASLDVGE